MALKPAGPKYSARVARYGAACVGAPDGLRARGRTDNHDGGRGAFQTSIPERSTFLLLSLSGLAFGGVRRFRRWLRRPGVIIGFALMASAASIVVKPAVVDLYLDGVDPELTLQIKEGIALIEDAPDAAGDLAKAYRDARKSVESEAVCLAGRCALVGVGPLLDSSELGAGAARLAAGSCLQDRHDSHECARDRGRLTPESPMAPTGCPASRHNSRGWPLPARDYVARAEFAPFRQGA